MAASSSSSGGRVGAKMCIRDSIMALLPVIPLSMKYAVKCGAKEGSLGWFLLKDVLLCTIMVFVICFVLTWVVTGMDAMFVNRLLAPMPLLLSLIHI